MKSAGFIDWRQQGFAAPPVPTVATGDERVYRAWGGTSTQRGNPGGRGVCFSLDKARSRYEAERLYSVMEWGNAVMRITEFSMPANTPYWIGKVDPGDSRFPLGRFSGSQIFVVRDYVRLLRPIETTRLLDDLEGRFVTSLTGHA